MVKRIFVLAVILTLTAASLSASFVIAQDRVYSFDKEWAQIFINQDGTVDLIYNITVSLQSGREIIGVDIGQPTGDFTIGEAVDQYGNELIAWDGSSGSNYIASVDFNQRLQPGDSIWFTLTTNVAGLIQNDSTNPGNYGMEFAPQWISSLPVNDVRVQIIMPEGVQVSDVKTLPDKFWNSTSTVEGKTAVYWQIGTIQANEQYLIGVSFPAQYLPNYTPTPTSNGIEDWSTFIPLIVLAIIAVIIIVGVVNTARKSTYTSPKVSMETLGIKRGLTAVEASSLLELKPTHIVTEILYSLLQKRAIWVEGAKPSLKLRILTPYENKTGTKENPLRYYEIDFLQSLKTDGALNEEKLAHTVTFLRDTVEKKLSGYNRKETIEYYKKIVTKAWTQVEQAGTAELASNAYNEQLLWLMLDPNQKTRTQTIFQDRIFRPEPLWFWWWYGYTTYHPNPTYQPNVNVPTQSGPAPAIPGAEFANNIATAVENTTSNIVTNLEKFANSIVPPPPKTSHQPARRGSDCVCACHTCACACACVSCACACAGGGAR